MKTWLVPLLVAALLILTPRAAAGQQALEVRIDAVDTSAYPTIRATVSVLDSSGRPAVDVPAEAFKGSVGGTPLLTTSLTGSSDEGLGIAVVLMFDLSGSIQGPALQQAKEAGKTLINELRPNDQVAVAAFSSSVRLVQDFTQDRPALTAAIDGLFAGGNTALYDAVVRSLEIAKGSPLPRRSVVLLSDGQDFGGVSQTDRASSISVAGSAGVPLFLIGLGSLADQPYLEELAAAARGQLFLAPTADTLGALYQSIGAVLRQQYVLEMDASGLSVSGAQSLRVEVNGAAGSGAAEAPVDLPAPVVPSVAPPTEPPVTPPATTMEEDGGSGLALVVGAGAAALAGVLVVGGGTAWVWRTARRRRTRAEHHDALRRLVDSTKATPIFAGTGPREEVAYDAWLQLTTGEGDEIFPLGDSPVTIGFSGDCDVQLTGGSGRRSERVRVWRREGRYMLNILSRLGSVTVGGQAARMLVLEDGDGIEIGTQRLVFHSRDKSRLG